MNLSKVRGWLWAGLISRILRIIAQGYQIHTLQLWRCHEGIDREMWEEGQGGGGLYRKGRVDTPWGFPTSFKYPHFFVHTFFAHLKK